MKRIEIPQMVIQVPAIIAGIVLLLVLIFYTAAFIEIGIRYSQAVISIREADALAYRNKKISESVDDKVLAWERIKNCR